MHHPVSPTDHLNGKLIAYAHEDARDHLRSAVYLNLFLLATLTVRPNLPLGGSLTLDENNALVLLSTLLPWLFLRFGKTEHFASVVGCTVLYLGILTCDLVFWFNGLLFSLGSGFTKGFMLSFVIAGLPYLYVVLRVGSLLLFGPLLWWAYRYGERRN